MATQRISQVASHLDPRTWSGKGLASAQLQNDSDVVIVASTRTPYCKAFKGGLKDTPFDILCLETFKAILAQSDIDPTIIQDVVVGNVRNVDNHYDIRAAALAAGIKYTTPTYVVNRFCASGLMAIRSVANQIQAGEIECGLALGIESMSNHPKRVFQFSEEISAANQDAADCIQPMGWTSENVAKDFQITRQEMDQFAHQSHTKAARARREGAFKDEISPIRAQVKNSDGSVGYRVIEEDDGIRENTTPESLAKIRPAFPDWEPAATTGGNASQLTDGGAAVLLMRRSLARKLNKKILGKYVACSVVGLQPRIMGIGPSLAIPAVLELTGIKQDEVDIFEINEAFSSMGVYCKKKLGISDEKLNTRGGAVALGHPLGSTGARLVVTALSQLEKRKQKVAVTSMCIGLGHAAAAVFIRED